MADFTPERWLPVAGWEGLYEVSDHGRVKGTDRTRKGNKGAITQVRGRVLQLYSHNRSKHLMAHLFNDGKRSRYFVHRLVLFAFVGPPADDQECAHGDGNPENNMLSNLRWATRKENMGDKVLHGTLLQGTSHGMASLTEAEVLEIRAAYKREDNGRSNTKELQARYGISHSHIWLIVTRQRWSHI